MIPLKDENPTRQVPVITLALIAACVLIYFFVQPTGQATLMPADADDQVRDEIVFNLEHAAIPCEIVEGRPLTEGEVSRTLRGDGDACEASPESRQLFPGKNVLFAIAYSMFLHGGLLHLGGNMLYLWVFGNNIEDTRGKVQYLLFYLLAGVVATGAHIALAPSSTVPLVGASGAIAGVMGAYLVMFPTVPIRTLFLFILITVRDIQARWLLGFWFISQFFISPASGVAWAAHVGGFVFGIVAGLIWRAIGPRRGRRSPSFLGA